MVDSKTLFLDANNSTSFLTRLRSSQLCDPEGRRILLVLSKSCGMSVKDALGSLKFLVRFAALRRDIPLPANTIESEEGLRGRPARKACGGGGEGFGCVRSYGACTRPRFFHSHSWGHIHF